MSLAPTLLHCTSRIIVSPVPHDAADEGDEVGEVLRDGATQGARAASRLAAGAT